MKNIEMINAANRLEEFVEKDKVIPVEVSFAIAANLNELHRKLEPFESERQRLLKKSDAGESMEEDFKKLYEMDVDIDIRRISKESIPTDLSTKDIIALNFMID